MNTPHEITIRQMKFIGADGSLGLNNGDTYTVDIRPYSQYSFHTASGNYFYETTITDSKGKSINCDYSSIEKFLENWEHIKKASEVIDSIERSAYDSAMSEEVKDYIPGLQKGCGCYVEESCNCLNQLTQSEEVKEEWEETFDECYSDRCDYELCCSGRDCACSGIKTADAIKDFIRTQRSLAQEECRKEHRDDIRTIQQEILDRVREDINSLSCMNGVEGLESIVFIAKEQVLYNLSTLKDTNI